MIVLIEDDPSQSRILSVFLTQGGNRVTVASDRDQALAALRDLSPRVVISDLTLPGVPDCYGWMRELRQLHSGTLIVTTGRSEQDLEVLARTLRIFYFLKPYSVDELLNALVSGDSRT